MEERHRISEPRPVLNVGSMPSWEVDILRDDTMIVDTFLLNNEVLPPRTNKKGKVVWRLPDKADSLPSFGTDDRRRILDIFKERKKKRKQEKKKRGDHSPPQSAAPVSGKCGRRDSTTTSPRVKGGGVTGTVAGKYYERRDSANKPPGEEVNNGSGAKPGTAAGKYYERRESAHKPPGEDGMNGGGTNAKHKGKENGKSSQNLSKERDGREYTEIDKGQIQKKKAEQVERGRGVDRASSNGSHQSQPSLTPTPPPPGLRSTPIQASSQGSNYSRFPASGQPQSESHDTQLYRQVPSTPDPSRMSLDESQEKSTPTQQGSAHESLPAQTLFIQPMPIDALFITVPRHERPESLPGHPESSLAVPAARHFISNYYSHFNGTLPGAQIGDLIRYYTPKAQKSVSIGGAHSVVAGRRDIAAQILNLAGASFVVRGVVAQDAADGKGVHILVTGTARTSLNGAPGGVLANFAHSISLVPIDGGVSREVYRRRGDGSCPALLEALDLGFPFQIHNDALALLSGDAGPVTPTPIPQTMQMPQQPPPPPGMF